MALKPINEEGILVSFFFKFTFNYLVILRVLFSFILSFTF